jgi:parallel beta-helix repeat protein
MKSFSFIFAFCWVSTAYSQANFQKKYQTQMIMVENGQNVDFEEGTMNFSSTLSLEGKENVVISGKGMDKTILSFKGQTDGAEGIRISNAKNITIKDMTLQDAKGDLLKTMNVAGIKMINVKTEWTGTPNKNNGAYGVYPVQCTNVLIDGCVAIGASDAGIYVGQSKDIIVKNCKAINNVAGIEIENSLNAQVFDNEATGNTGGVLVFDLPDLVQKKGGNVKVFNNNIHDNNYKNFAPKGNIVGKVPAGTGVLILATSDVEVFNNKIENNKTVGAGIISYFMTENPIKDEGYDPYPTAIYLHDNEFVKSSKKPTAKGRFGQLISLKLRLRKNTPFIMWDGIVKENSAQNVLCLKNNKNQTYINLDAANDFKNMSRDIEKVKCEK